MFSSSAITHAASWYSFLHQRLRVSSIRVLTFQTLTAGTVSASKHKIASNVFLHGIRHWGQIATVLRQNDFADQWSHDLLLSSVKM